MAATVLGQRFPTSMSTNNLSMHSGGGANQQQHMLGNMRANNNNSFNGIRSVSAGNYDAQQYAGQYDQQSAYAAQLSQSAMGSFGNNAANGYRAAPTQQQQQSAGGWRARAEQQEQYAQAVAQQQQMLQFEMLKLQAYQQAQMQNQYLAQAQAQMAMLAINNQNQQQASAPAVSPNGTVNPQAAAQAKSYSNSHLGMAVGMGVNLREQRQNAQARALQSVRLRASPREDGVPGLSPNALEFMPGSGSRQNDSRSPSRSASPTSEASLSASPQTPSLMVSTVNGLDYSFPITVEDVASEPNDGKYRMQYTAPAHQRSLSPPASRSTAIAYTLRQPRGPPTAEVKDLGELNFAQRARRQLGGRLGGLRDLAQQRQSRF